jgi:hypothetical protein
MGGLLQTAHMPEEAASNLSLGALGAYEHLNVGGYYAYDDILDEFHVYLANRGLVPPHHML